MPIDEVEGKPWTREHDDPRVDLIPRAERIVYPRSLEELVDLCTSRPPDQRFKAAGSHWALSEAAISDHTFIETHDPREAHQAMGRTLDDVVPGRLNRAYLQHMVDAGSDGRWYLAHIESGKRIYQAYAELDQVVDINDGSTLAGVLNRDFGDPGFGGPWAFRTLGGAGGQTVVGALSTGTNGGDFDRPPVADAVVAIHLVADGGKQYWIEPVEDGVPPLTDDAEMESRFRTPGRDDGFEIIRNNDVFNAVLVSVGRFGVIYSVILKVVPQYALHEKRRIHLWQDVKDQITDMQSPLYRDIAPGGTDGEQRFLQVAVSLTTHANFTRNLASLTKRWDVPMSGGINGHAERVGDPEGFAELIQATRFTKAGRSHAYNPDPDDRNRPASPSMLELACSDGSFVRGVLQQAVGELAEFVTSGGAIVGTALTAILTVAGGGVLALLAALALIVDLVKEIIEGWDDDTRFAEAMDKVRRELLDPDETDPARRAAGLLAWQLIFFIAFQDQEEERDFSAVSYAVMDTHGYLDESCRVNVDSMEVFFDATDDRLIAFVDALIGFEILQEIQGRAFVGYASLRFTGKTRALIGMERWDRTCAIEIACLKDVRGGSELMDYAAAWARNPNSGAILHWGQRNDAERPEIERIFAAELPRWRRALARITDEGSSDGFSSAFTQRTGLEVV